MEKINKGSVIVIIAILAISLSGCWNYSDIEKLSIVMGMTIDKDKATQNYLITMEVIDIQLGVKEATLGTTLVSSQGKSVFDAIRNAINKHDKKLYFSHMKILIISDQIAKEGIIPSLDFMNRHGETRHDLDILVAKCKASTILTEYQSTSNIISTHIYESLETEDSLSKAPKIELWEFINDISEEGKAAILPRIDLVTEGNKKEILIEGTGVFKGDKLLGYLNGDDTKILLLIKNRIKGGLFIVEEIDETSDTNVTLEIFDNKTKRTPRVEGENITMQIEIATSVSVGENLTNEDFTKEEGLKKLKDVAESEIETDVQKLVKKVQKEFKSDIFGFGEEIRAKKPEVWKEVKDNWDQAFMVVEVDVKADIKIDNAGFEAEPIKVGL